MVIVSGRNYLLLLAWFCRTHLVDEVTVLHTSSNAQLFPFLPLLVRQNYFVATVLFRCRDLFVDDVFIVQRAIVTVILLEEQRANLCRSLFVVFSRDTFVESRCSGAANFMGDCWL